MTNQIQSVAIDKLLAHPDNPNRMSKANFAKLVHNIERTGRYEPLVVRPSADRPGYFQIINGYHRWQALSQVGHKKADVVVWDVDDDQADILLATLNRLAGSDVLDKKLALLRRLTDRMQAGQLAKLLPQTAKQIERLANMKLPKVPAAAKALPTPMVFFLNDEQVHIVEDALFLAQLNPLGAGSLTKAAKKAAGLTEIAKFFLATSRSTQG
jgi:ParB/RepB/Spo0J family partition protein